MASQRVVYFAAAGIPLFPPEGGGPHRLELIRSEGLPGGMVHTHHRVVSRR